MTTVITPVLSDFDCWKMKPRNIERMAAKRADYWSFSYREIRERETYKDKGGVGHVVPGC